MSFATDIAGLLSVHSLTLNGVGNALWENQVIILETLAQLMVSYMVIRCTYLLFFHPLARFPGPRLAAVSNVPYAKMWLSGRFPHKCQELYWKFGSVVRLAPNELLFFGPQAYYDIHDSAVHNRETFVKTDFQTLDDKDPGITAERDPEKHHQVGRKLKPAFSARSLKCLEPIMHKHVNLLINQISKHGAEENGINMTEWMDWFFWDVSADFAYGRTFGHIENIKTSLFLATFKKVSLWGTINQVFKRFPLISPLGWLFVPPSLVRIFPTLIRMNREEVRDRIARENSLPHPDLIQYLFPKGSEEMPSENWFLSHANVLVLAGFDPMTNLATSLFYYLCRFPEVQKRLNEEIRSTFKSYNDIVPTALQNLKYLNATLNEALRIHTNAAFGTPRISPGAMVDGHYVPKGVTVQTCHYATTHDEKNFALPNEFHPERHLPETHPLFNERFKEDNKRAFVPFSMGPRGCPGYAFAFMQARLTVACIMWSFDFELTNGDEINWERDTKMYAMWEKPEMRIRFTRRGEELV
ncbi:cytochrome P450 [Xylariaceae sp. FL1651]|nr:cytochrome P450 [Xylariaceae sp. FL1651]